MKEHDKKHHYAAPANANRDPLTGEPGSHPVGAGIGAAAGAVAGAAIGTAATAAATGAAIGSAAGPIGVAAGAILGGIAGGLAGKGVAEAIDPTAEEAYWRENAEDYHTHASAYRYGVDAYGRYEGRRFDEIEPQLGGEWKKARGASTLDWTEARNAARDAYSRIDQNVRTARDE